MSFCKVTRCNGILICRVNDNFDGVINFLTYLLTLIHAVLESFIRVLINVPSAAEESVKIGSIAPKYQID